MLHLAEAGPPGGWRPPIVRTVASREEGVPRLLEEVERHGAWLAASGELVRRRQAHLRLRVETILKERVLAEAELALGVEREVERGFAARLDPYAVAERLFAGVLAGRAPLRVEEPAPGGRRGPSR
jgi:LAO/AO transport system kinase